MTLDSWTFEPTLIFLTEYVVECWKWIGRDSADKHSCRDDIKSHAINDKYSGILFQLLYLFFFPGRMLLLSIYNIWRRFHDWVAFHLDKVYQAMQQKEIGDDTTCLWFKPEGMHNLFAKCFFFFLSIKLIGGGCWWVGGKNILAC